MKPSIGGGGGGGKVEVLRRQVSGVGVNNEGGRILPEDG